MQEEALKMADVIVMSSLIIAGLSGLIILFVVVHRQKILRKEIELKQNEALHQKDLLNAAIAAQEMEQARIAKDLHDDLGALLSSLKLRVTHFERQEPSKEAVGVYSSEMKQMLGDGIQSVRRIVNDLLPPVLKDFGLKEGIEELVTNFRKATEIQINASVSWDDKRLPMEMELPIYRITQELFNNSIKHSKARNIWLHILVDEGKLILEYRDDGKGFDPDTQKRNLGFRNFESRTQALEGTFEFSSESGKGFRAFFEFPIKANDNEQ